MILWQFHPIAATFWMAIRDRRIRIGVPTLLAAILLMVSAAAAGPAISRTDPGTHKVVWAFFKDKGVLGSEAQAQAVDRARQSLTARALARARAVPGGTSYHSPAIECSSTRSAVTGRKVPGPTCRVTVARATPRRSRASSSSGVK